MNPPDTFDPPAFKHRLHQVVCAIIDSADRALTATELYDTARTHVPHIALSTIRRALNELVMNGSLREAAVTGEPTRYERPAPTAPPTDSSPHKTLDYRALPTLKSDRPPQPPYRTIPDPNEPATNLPTPSRPQLSHRPETVPPSKPPCLGPAQSLASVSHDDAEKYLATIRPALDAIDRHDLPARSCVALPPGLDRSALRQLPFRVRTRNCLNAAGLFDGNGLLTVRDLLRLPGFGELSLRDLLIVVSDYLNQCIRDAPSEFSQQPPLNTPDVDPSHSPKLPVSDPDGIAPSISLEAPFTRLLVAASEFQGADTLADLLSPDVARLASVIGVLDDFRALSVALLSKANTNHSAIVMHDAKQLCDRLTPSQRTVLELRLLASPRKTLDDVGTLLGVTRERVRQIQAKITKHFDHVFRPELSEMATLLKSELGPIAPSRDVDSRLNDLFVDDGTMGPHLARHVLKSHLGYSRRVRGFYLDEAAFGVLQRIKSAAPRFAEDAIIDQARLKSVLPNPSWQQHWPLLLTCCAFHEVFGLLALRDSARTRTKAALLSIGTPATREDIAELSGLSVPQVGSYLSSFPNVVRADKSRWGLTEWIDDEYEGIEAEIVQRIDEGGGVTSTNRLLDELPRKFGVSAASVNAYLQSPKFLVDGSHVTLATATSRQFATDAHRALPTLPGEWKIQTALRCGSVCGLSLSPRITQGLLQLRALSLLELYFYLEHQISNAEFANVIRTDDDRRLVGDAYAEFHDLLLKSRRDGRISEDKLEWIVPHDYTKHSSEIDPNHIGLVTRELEHAFGSRALSTIVPDLWDWLPWVPLSVVQHLRTWRAPRINAVQRALFKLAGDMHKAATAFYPWEPGFNSDTRTIPIQALFQYEPTSLTRGAIHALRDSGLTSINDLRCLHPNAILAAKSPDAPLLRIYRSLASPP